MSDQTKKSTRVLADELADKLSNRFKEFQNQNRKSCPQPGDYRRLLRLLEDCEHFGISLPAGELKQLILRVFPEAPHCNQVCMVIGEFPYRKPLQSVEKKCKHCEARYRSLENLYSQW